MKIPKIISGAITALLIGSAQGNVAAQGLPNDLVQQAHDDENTLSGCTSDNHYIELGFTTTSAILVTKENEGFYDILHGAFADAHDHKFEQAVAQYSKAEIEAAFDQYVQSVPFFEIPVLKGLYDDLRPLEQAFEEGIAREAIAGEVRHALRSVYIEDVSGTQDCAPSASPK